MTKILVDKEDLGKVIDYLDVSCQEKKDYEQWGNPKPKNHIWLVVKRLKKTLRRQP